ncbi:MAG: hypothetical protein PHQ19_05880 [Candidatus Krumholzibacteria bacterium]|nr:hypothetical protein [Candidatus Krumholzibacteria bacterium]
MTARKLRMLTAALAVAAALCGPAPSGAQGAGPDSSMVLEGGTDGTVFTRMTIEGEDRFRIEFERPTLRIALDPAAAPGLDWDNTWDVLAEGAIDLRAPLLRLSALEPSPYLPRPWHETYAHGEIVRFKPALTGVERWRLTIADSRSGEVRVFEGTGNPPERIGWDGLSAQGAPMPPGYTYSYVVEAWDRAGNKRNFVGKGFDLPAYRMAAGGGLAFLFAGSGLSPRQQGRAAPAPAILEAASRINQEPGSGGAVRVTVTARTYDQANSMAEEIARSLGSLLLGGPARIRHVADVRADAPEAGTIAIVLERET